MDLVLSVWKCELQVCVQTVRFGFSILHLEMCASGLVSSV